VKSLAQNNSCCYNYTDVMGPVIIQYTYIINSLAATVKRTPAGVYSSRRPC